MSKSGGASRAATTKSAGVAAPKPERVRIESPQEHEHVASEQRALAASTGNPAHSELASIHDQLAQAHRDLMLHWSVPAVYNKQNKAHIAARAAAKEAGDRTVAQIRSLNERAKEIQTQLSAGEPKRSRRPQTAEEKEALAQRQRREYARMTPKARRNANEAVIRRTNEKHARDLTKQIAKSTFVPGYGKRTFTTGELDSLRRQTNGGVAVLTRLRDQADQWASHGTPTQREAVQSARGDIVRALGAYARQRDVLASAPATKASAAPTGKPRAEPLASLRERYNRAVMISGFERRLRDNGVPVVGDMGYPLVDLRAELQARESKGGGRDQRAKKAG